jgi:hypothetical protein
MRDEDIDIKKSFQLSGFPSGRRRAKKDAIPLAVTKAVRSSPQNEAID